MNNVQGQGRRILHQEVGGPLGLTVPQPASATWSLRVLAACAVIALLYFASSVFLPLVVATFLFYALDPIVDRLHALRLPRLFAAVLVVSTLLGTVGLGTIMLWPQVEAVVAKVPQGAQRLRATVREMRAGSRSPSPLRRVQDAAKAIDLAAEETTVPPSTVKGALRVEVTEPWRASDWLWSGSLGALGLIGQATTVLFLTVFLLNENDSFKKKLVQYMETLGSKRLTVQILSDIALQIERFIWVQALTSAVVAVMTALGLWWLGVGQPIVWGVFAGLMNIVPYFGPLIVTAVLTTVAFLQFGTFIATFNVAGMALIITTLEGNVLTPYLLSRVASLNPVAIFVSIAFWSWLWGVPGMLLAVPLLMAIKVVCDHVSGLEPLGRFLGE